MKELFIKILRFLMFVLVVALGCIGYNIYEDTLAAVWIPVGVGLVVAVVTLPLYKKWIWLTTMEQKAVNILCHVVCVGVISCAVSEYCRSPVVILNVYVKVLWMSNSAILENGQYSLLFGGGKETFTFADPVVGSPAKKTH